MELHTHTPEQQKPSYAFLITKMRLSIIALLLITGAVNNADRAQNHRNDDPNRYDQGPCIWRRMEYGYQ